MKDFKVLNLSIPSLDSSECKSLMGGDGYDIDGGNLFDFDIVVTSNRPDSPDYDEDLLRDSLDEDQGDNDFSHEHDDNQDNDYKVPDQLKETFAKLPESIQNFLRTNNITLVYNPNYRSSNGGIASYNPADKSIITSSFDDNTLLREVIHAVQDSIGAMDTKSMSAEEFQEKALGDLMEYYSTILGDNILAGYGMDNGYIGNSGWVEFMGSCFDEDGNFNRETFINGIMDFFDIFQEAHKNISGYNDPLEDDYNWNWNYFFDLLGL